MKTEFIKLAVGQPYPLDVQTGITADFLRVGGNRLLVCLDDLNKDEAMGFKKAPLVGLIVELPVILFLFDFDKAGKYDSSFDIKLNQRKGDLALHSIENKEQRLAVEMHLVEQTTKEIKALRLFTFPNDLTLEFLSAAQDQLAMHYDAAMYDATLKDIYRYDIETLIKNTRMYQAGT